MADNSNSTMEMGTSDQVLVATKRKKTLGYIIGTVAMLAVIGVVITLVVVLTGNEAGPVEPIVSTEGPTTPIEPSSSTTTSTTTTESPTSTEAGGTTTESGVTEPPLTPLELEEIIEGIYSPPSFNASWSTGSEVLFRNANGDLVLYDVDTDSTTPLVYNSSQILQQSSRVMQLSADGTEVILAYYVVPVYRYSFRARYAAINYATGHTVDILPSGIDAEDAFLQNFVWGPSGTSLAFVYLNNIYYQDHLNNTPRQITTTGQLNVIYHGIPDWVYEEEVFGSSNAIWFSKDGNKMAFVTFDDSGVRVMRVPHFGVPGSVNYQYTQHHEIRYPKPGTANPLVTVTLIDLNTNVLNVYSAPEDLTQPILKTVKFVSNLAIALVWTDRVQTTMRVQICTHGQATCTLIYSYTEANGWIDNIPFFFNEAGNAFITILPQAVDGVMYKQIVQASQGTTALWQTQNRINMAHTVLEILAWNANGEIWYKATSVEDSAEQHIFVANSTGVFCFTCAIRRPDDGGECLYNEGMLSNSGDRITINCAGPDVPQVFIYNTNGSLVRVWDDSAELRSITSNRVLPASLRLNVNVGVGLPPADVHIQAPADYQNRTNVPLLVYVYGGPDTALVTKQWTLDWGSSLVSRWGIAIAHIDGRGSGLRGVTNMFALNRRLGTVEIEDQISVTKYLQDNLNWIDGNRTCIWGWSYGGYAASKALAEGGSVFRCAAAVAPVVDWRFYDTIYTERYMDLPSTNAEGYAVSSLLTEQVAEALREKSYFLIHGTADDNVHYQHAMLLSRMLQRRDVYFTQMSYTDEDHGLVGVRPHLYHALEKFLQEHMF
nr:venom dipeptidyl peptidase 4 isoform X1 [Helicoverpa armigera]XP_049696841.1 venom dipeptidyl peptidase 4 isoform X1 [Helicoverpa armigera]XP_049696842.1 venom dipeptidyl peptidase 4 isoform X1 [Helicoverpa armigera]XP_049696843.1 venom dipeptidyl peptidase 4 isoform X1 [Helicoverpa armigera]